MLRVKTVIKNSDIEGTGLFAAEFIPKGQLIWKFDAGLDIEIPVADLNPRTSRYDKITIDYLRRYVYLDKYKKVYILVGDNNRFINHSDFPNVGTFNGKEETWDCYAQCDIAEGEELTENYTTFGDPFLVEEVKKWRQLSLARVREQELEPVLV